jgi:ligand-binding SRPBCC domain-containing protein
MVHRAQFEQWVGAPLGDLVRFFGDPNNLPRLMPRWMRVKLETAHITPPSATSDSPNPFFAGPGSVLTASYRPIPFLPFRICSEARITGFAWQAYFEDEQGKGPFKYWHHRHDFQREVRNGVEGTLVRDTIEYDPGLGALGSIASRLFIAPQLRRTFEFRQKTLQEIVDRNQLATPAPRPLP